MIMHINIIAPIAPTIGVLLYMSLANKVVTHILNSRISNALSSGLRKEQALGPINHVCII